MSTIAERDVVSAIGPVDELIIRETLRTGASLVEFQRAVRIVREAASAPAPRALTGRMQRLVDLLSVALEPAPCARDMGAATAEPAHRAA